MTVPSNECRYNVLVVDDNEISRQIASVLLEDCGVSVTAAAGGAECIELVGAGNNYDIIFMDYVMPDMDGAAALAMLRQTERESNRHNVIALSGEDDAQAEQRFMDMGFDGYVSKPLSRQTAIGILNRYLPDYADQSGHTCADDISEQTVDIPQNVTLPMIDGVQPLSAIADCGGFGSWQKTVKTFCSHIGPQSDAIERYLSNNDIANYVIEVHALKTASRIIGCASLSELSARLEMLGRQQRETPSDERFSRIDTLTDELLSDYRGMLPILQDIADYDMHPHDVKSEMADWQFDDMLMQISDAAEAGDLETVDDFIETLRMADLSPDRMSIAEQIFAAAADIDFERIISIAGQSKV